MTRVRSGARLHASLLDLGRATHRAFGGVGFMISGPPTLVYATPSRVWELRTSCDLEPRALTELRALLDRLRKLSPRKATIVTVHQTATPHVGLGSKTTLALSVVLAVAGELNVHLSQEAMQKLTRRGGASGVGLHGFFHGGLIVDAGHPQTHVKQLVPSSASRPRSLPTLQLRRSVSPTWRFHLFLPRGRRLQSDSEQAFFQSNTPIPGPEVYAAIAAVYHGIVPAVESADLPLLADAMRTLNTAGFKRRELAAQPRVVRDLHKVLSSHPRIPVGLSSVGPLIFAITQADDSPTPRAISRAISDEKAGYLGSFPALNSGVCIERG